MDVSIPERPRQLRSEVDKQDLGLFPRRERDRALRADAGAVAGAQDQFAETHLAVDEVEPRASPG